MSEASIESRIAAIVSALQTRGKPLNLIASAAAPIVGPTAGYLCYRLGPLSDDSPEGLTVAFAIMVGFIGAMLPIWIANEISEKLAKHAADEFRDRFPGDSDERPLAEAVLANLEQPLWEANLLRKQLGVKSQLGKKKAEARQRDERRKAAETRRAAEALRSTRVVASSFRCGLCHATVDVQWAGQVVTCRRCSEQLEVPGSSACPKCDIQSMRISEEHAISRPGHAYRWAGLLTHGMAGFLVGGVVDGALHAMKGGDAPGALPGRFVCGHCKHQWGLRLPPAKRSSQQEQTEGENDVRQQEDM